MRGYAQVNKKGWQRVPSSKFKVQSQMPSTLNLELGTHRPVPVVTRSPLHVEFRGSVLPFKDSRMAILHITDASGRAWQLPISPRGVCTIGRAPDNRAVLNDPRASRYHAHVKFQHGTYVIVDGSVDGKLSANHVFVNGEQRLGHPLRDRDRVQIGRSQLRLDLSDERRKSEPETQFQY